MKIRNVSIKDYEKIKILLKRHDLNMIDFKRWVNLWKKNPSLKNNKIKWIKGWVIEKNNKIVGHVGHFPMQYFLNKKPYLCSVIYGWAVDEQFRSLSILLLKRYFSQKNVDLFLATNLNETSSKIMKMLKVKEVPTKSLNYSLVVALNLQNVIKVFFRNIPFPFKKFILNIFSSFLLLFLKKKYPIIKLSIISLFLLILALAFLRFYGDFSPNTKYSPAKYENGKLVPAENK